MKLASGEIPRLRDAAPDVDPQIEQIPPSSLKVSFVVNEGPKVKVGEINIVGNHAFKRQWVIRSMKNTHPIGVPYSIFLENLFAKTYDSANSCQASLCYQLYTYCEGSQHDQPN